ncbi:MAG: beta-propeller domain-containing protein [Thaumarchaeota archaeon]|nr:beta-propeller domain-containing protein [Nitrososphaerota archaeon]
MCAAVERKFWHREAAVFVLAILGIAAVVGVFALASGASTSNGSTPKAIPQGLSTFESYSQLQQYITANAKSAQQYNTHGVFFGGVMNVNGGLPVGFGGPVLALTASVASIPSFTGTNVQVQGVDEPDRVKTDGTHLFVSTQNSVAIINAYPPNSMAVLSSLKFPNMNVLGLEIAQDRLMVIGQEGSGTSKVELLLYDTSDLSSPKMMQNVSIAGFYVAARLADGYVYAVIQQPSYVFNSQGNATAVMPMASQGGVESQLAPTSVYYTPIATQVSYYTMIPSISMASGKETIVSALTGPSATVYVSTSNIYVVYTDYLDLYDVDGVPGNFYSGGVITPQIVVAQAQNSTVLRASYVNGTVTVAKAGIVPGTVLNQFSMDEYNGYFRIATSRFATVNGAPTTSDDVYVLDQNMNQVSALKNIAPGENIYAVRFVGQMGYVVTFVQVDPLFVISFKDVSNPVILSALKVSGYSDYLHPLPGGYLIGVGKDAVPASDGNFAYYLGLKLSLFRVFDNGTSAQVAKLLIGDRGTDSPVLSDHLAFTFDSTRNITVIPLTLYKVSGTQTPSSGFPPYGDPVWQGVYVIKVTPSGFDVLGNATQYQGQSFADSPNSGLQIDRSVIIGDYLYTVSQDEVMVSALTSFSTVATVQLPS